MSIIRVEASASDSGNAHNKANRHADKGSHFKTLYYFFQQLWSTIWRDVDLMQNPECACAVYKLSTQWREIVFVSAILLRPCIHPNTVSLLKHIFFFSIWVHNILPTINFTATVSCLCISDTLISLLFHLFKKLLLCSFVIRLPWSALTFEGLKSLHSCVSCLFLCGESWSCVCTLLILIQEYVTTRPKWSFIVAY